MRTQYTHSNNFHLTFPDKMTPLKQNIFSNFLSNQNQYSIRLHNNVSLSILLRRIVRHSFYNGTANGHKFSNSFFSILLNSFLFFQFALSSQIRNMSPIFFFLLAITLFYDSFKRFYVEKVGVLWATLRVIWFFLGATVTLFFFSMVCIT